MFINLTLLRPSLLFVFSFSLLLSIRGLRGDSRMDLLHCCLSVTRSKKVSCGSSHNIFLPGFLMRQSQSEFPLVHKHRGEGGKSFGSLDLTAFIFITSLSYGGI
ncbi:hypothetical protein Mapa_000719 [Marchantia paleacea]|nr:hypothetical protein Mapa_000719 [Marchantia paleacea]